jgi:hypothetical protein
MRSFSQLLVQAHLKALQLHALVSRMLIQHRQQRHRAHHDTLVVNLLGL